MDCHLKMCFNGAVGLGCRNDHRIYALSVRVERRERAPAGHVLVRHQVLQERLEALLALLQEAAVVVVLEPALRWQGETEAREHLLQLEPQTDRQISRSRSKSQTEGQCMACRIMLSCMNRAMVTHKRCCSQRH